MKWMWLDHSGVRREVRLPPCQGNGARTVMDSVPNGVTVSIVGPRGAKSSVSAKKEESIKSYEVWKPIGERVEGANDVAGFLVYVI